MSGVMVFACVLVALVLVLVLGVFRAVEDRRAQDEHDELQRELKDEIYRGGNVARIAALRKRLQELEDAGCRWR